ncbi:MAG: hypothetical protein HY254_25600 [Burkholderiales bacterium]|nr:hypothetical protein [Burkholderiales bacterium]
MCPLRKQMQSDMVLRGLAPRTQEAYIGAVAGLARYYKRSLEFITQETTDSDSTWKNGKGKTCRKRCDGRLQAR